MTEKPRMSLDARKAEGLAYFLAFMACIPAANWMIGHLGTTCAPNGPCLVPVFPWSSQGGPMMAPSGVSMIGIALVLRDLVQRRLGRVAALMAIITTARLIMMLVMKPMSSNSAGTGTTMNMTSSRMPIGRTAPCAVRLQIWLLTSLRVMSGVTFREWQA